MNGRLTISHVLDAVIVCLVAIILAVPPVVFWRLQRPEIVHREIHLPVIRTNSDMEFMLHQEFSRVRQAWILRGMNSHYIPSTREAAIEWLKIPGDDDVGELEFVEWQLIPHFASGIDPWGRPLIVEVSLEPTLDGFIMQHVVLRSVGVNGRDEEGKGDDIQRVFCGGGLPPLKEWRSRSTNEKKTGDMSRFRPRPPM